MSAVAIMRRGDTEGCRDNLGNDDVGKEKENEEEEEEVEEEEQEEEEQEVEQEEEEEEGEEGKEVKEEEERGENAVRKEGIKSSHHISSSKRMGERP